MSFKAINWAFKQSPNKPIQKYLLIILAYRVDDNYQCYPSISCIVKDTGMGRRTIQTHLRDLLDQGFIKISGRVSSSNVYTLCTDNAETTGDKESSFFQLGSKKTAPPPCEPRIQNKSINLSFLSTKKSTTIPPLDNFTAEMKAAYNWAKTEPFWSPKIEKISNFIRYYTTGDLKNQYLNILNKKRKKVNYPEKRAYNGQKTDIRPWDQKPKEIDKFTNLSHFQMLFKKFGDTALAGIPIEYHSQLLVT